MDTNEIVFLFRGIERLTVVGGAITCVVMGIRLYGGKVSFGGKSDLEAKGGGLEIKLTNAAPGAILALFGMVVMGFALRSPAEAVTAAPCPQPVVCADDHRPHHGSPSAGAEAGAPGAIMDDERKPAPRHGGATDNPSDAAKSSTTYAQVDSELASFVGELAGANLDEPKKQLTYFQKEAQSLDKEDASRKLLQEVLAVPDDLPEAEIGKRLSALKAKANKLR